MPLTNIYTKPNINIPAPGDSITPARHHILTDRYEINGPQNQTVGQTSSFGLLGWRRHSCERVVRTAGSTEDNYMLQGIKKHKFGVSRVGQLDRYRHQHECVLCHIRPIQRVRR